MTVINATSRFKRNAVDTRCYQVSKVVDHEGWLLTTLRLVGDDKKRLHAAIHKEAFENPKIDVDNILQLTCTGRLYRPQSNFQPYIILKSFEKMEGQVVNGSPHQFIEGVKSFNP